MLLLVIPCSYQKKWSAQIENQSFAPEEAKFLLKTGDKIILEGLTAVGTGLLTR
jgi:hypothetical protein